MTEKNSILLFIHVSFYKEGDVLFVERQAANGLRLWAENFDQVIVMAPFLPGPPPAGWIPVNAIGTNFERIEIELLPTAYRPDQFIRVLPSAGKTISRLIDQADYLCFGIGGLFGDWGSLACLIASRKKRAYAVWTDRVESEVARLGFKSHKLRRRLMARLVQPTMVLLEKIVISRAQLGLFHGKETYEAYRPYCKGQSELVHDIHISKSAHIPARALTEKIGTVREDRLRICYVGRMEEMKGPLDWLEILRGLVEASVDFEAIWLGDGSLRPRMLEKVDELGLTGKVITPGFVEDQAEILKTLRRAHIFLFCHKTPESPRSLIEALVSATPIVGYDSAYPRDLVADHGGGKFAPINDTTALRDVVIGLATDRLELEKLIAQAALAGQPFSDEDVFKHRSDLIKTYL